MDQRHHHLIITVYALLILAAPIIWAPRADAQAPCSAGYSCISAAGPSFVCPAGYVCTPLPSIAQDGSYYYGYDPYGSWSSAAPATYGGFYGAQTVFVSPEQRPQTYSNGYYYSQADYTTNDPTSPQYPTYSDPTVDQGLPLSVRCSGSYYDYGGRTGVVGTWTSDPSGGVGPYSYSWILSQDAVAARTDTKSVYARYEFLGNKQALVSVTDSSGASTQASCAMIIRSVPYSP